MTKTNNARTGSYRVDDRRDLGAFIPSELDDYGLSPAQFRVYCHVLRRAGSGKCWESVQSMTTRLRISSGTIKRCIKFLLNHGFIEKHSRPGKTTEYSVLSSSCWLPNSELTEPPGSPETWVAHDPPPGSPETQVPGSPETHEGTPIEVTPMKEDPPCSPPTESLCSDVPAQAVTNAASQAREDQRVEDFELTTSASSTATLPDSQSSSDRSASPGQELANQDLSASPNTKVLDSNPKSQPITHKEEGACYNERLPQNNRAIDISKIAYSPLAIALRRAGLREGTATLITWMFQDLGLQCPQDASEIISGIEGQIAESSPYYSAKFEGGMKGARLIQAYLGALSVKDAQNPELDLKYRDRLLKLEDFLSSVAISADSCNNESQGQDRKKPKPSPEMMEFYRNKYQKDIETSRRTFETEAELIAHVDWSLLRFIDQIDLDEIKSTLLK